MLSKDFVANTYKNSKTSSVNSVSEEERLLSENIGSIRYHANHVYRSSKDFVDYNDLINCGVIGLLESWKKFDDTKNIKFSTFASLRIRGEMIDFLRRCDWVPRSIRDDNKSIASAMASLQMEKGSMFSESDIAEKLGISIKNYRSKLNTMHISNVVSFEDISPYLNSDEDSISVLDSLESYETSPETNYRMVEFINRLGDAISSLNNRMQVIVCLYFQEELELKEIALILSVTESRVSQLLKEATLKIRTFLGIEI